MISIYRTLTQNQWAESGFPKIHCTLEVDSLGKQIGKPKSWRSQDSMNHEGQLLESHVYITNNILMPQSFYIKVLSLSSEGIYILQKFVKHCFYKLKLNIWIIWLL